VVAGVVLWFWSQSRAERTAHEARAEYAEKN
jgi:hypothetical protein